MNELDENLIYGGARRISEYEAELLDQIDDISDAQINMQTNLKRALETEKSKLEKTDKAIEMYCTETTKKKILDTSGRWQYGKEIKEALSDKEQIENLKQKMNKKTTVISMQSVVENAINNGVTNEQVNKADYLTKQLEQREDGLEGVFKDD